MPFPRSYSTFLSSNCLPKLNSTTGTRTNFSIPSVPTLLRACKTSLHLHQLHAHIIRKGLEQDHFLVTLFVSLSNSLSTLSYSTSVFNRVLRPNTFLWNSLIIGYCEKSHFIDAVSIFIRMKREERMPDKYTYPSLIKSCSCECEVRLGKSIHGSALRCGVEGDAYVRTSLINLYGKCREIASARKIFDDMSERSVVSWTAMVVGYATVGDLAEAKRLFDEMPQRNIVSWNAIIGGLVKLGELKGARRIFDEMPEKDVVSYTTMIDGYAKAGDMASARFLFEQVPDRDVFVWSALISGYAQNGQPNDALKVFLEMDSSGVKPDEYIMVSLMSACSQVGGLELAIWVDSYVSRSKIDTCQPHVAAARVDMNAKCGNMELATKLFEEMPKKDLISYCSMIQGLSYRGHGKQAVRLFNRMLNEGLAPDEVAFTVILTVCSHAGLVEEGWHYFESMKYDYSIVPSPDHYACMVDLLSRSGRLKEGYELIKSMPVEPHAGAWGALLGACKLQCDVELGEVIAARLLELEPHNPANYVLLSNIYAAADRWLDVSLVREKMKEKGVRKIPGCSWI
ncbi:putative pentatricopeptide repeat-containing protein At5g37570 [Juglans microcarpa x Juglans regia]|uniref:putative pentatricopeptide repeat-containing protein At5g37570 n=1 Tax=Juglans microcarpa x Juglans regia TaxID=2249226 RepID=UPI001B7EB2E7|nr:putative pentatricopeptide repeat-containing protein At5g37570 [Juglans microcarpa x Juglans regia]